MCVTVDFVVDFVTFVLYTHLSTDDVTTCTKDVICDFYYDYEISGAVESPQDVSFSLKDDKIEFLDQICSVLMHSQSLC